MLEYFYLLVLAPAYIMYACITHINEAQTFWQWYVITFPFLVILLPFVLKKYFKKVNILLLSLIVLFILQIIPLPRSPYSSRGGPYTDSPKNEPFAIGIGYPFALVKLFLGDGCLTNYPDCRGTSTLPGQPFTKLTPSRRNESPRIVHAGDIVVLPSSWQKLITPGFLVDGYILFLLGLGGKLFIMSFRNPSKKSPRR